jgi:sialate O-acetylesterase
MAHRIENGRVRVRFKNVGEGLIARGGALGGFIIAGEDRKFHWARARIDGDSVIAWSPEVPDPKAVRYAWANNPARANLYNSAGLPASCFRTDRWDR